MVNIGIHVKASMRVYAYNAVLKYSGIAWCESISNPVPIRARASYSNTRAHEHDFSYAVTREYAEGRHMDLGGPECRDAMWRRDIRDRRVEYMYSKYASLQHMCPCVRRCPGVVWSRGICDHNGPQIYVHFTINLLSI